MCSVDLSVDVIKLKIDLICYTDVGENSASSKQGSVLGYQVLSLWVTKMKGNILFP